MAWVFKVPPTWPTPPDGWVPPVGWTADPTWGPPPDDWQFWVDDAPYAAHSSGRASVPTAEPGQRAAHTALGKITVFNGAARARELALEVERLRGELERTGALQVADLREEATQLTAQITQQRQQLAQETQMQTATLNAEVARVRAELATLKTDVVTTEETALLQEAGVYDYHHPLSNAIAYQVALQQLQERVKQMNLRDGGAVVGSTNWQVNGSLPKGRAMVRDFSKLMLRAYNAEADNLVRSLRPYKLDAAVDRLGKVVTTIAKLGQTMGIHINWDYHQLRVQELQLTADYLAKQAEEKEREREERSRLREERVVQQEIERERVRLQKEKQHYLNAHQALVANGDHKGAARLQSQLDDVEKALTEVDYRAANIRAGYVYVISNIGAFGESMVKIGMTRRLEPMDRVRELGDASVPFRFDVHALFFSQDAVHIETTLHQRLSEKRVNMINARREFFRVTPAEVKALLADLTGDLLEFTDVPEALEYRQSLTAATTA